MSLAKRQNSSNFRNIIIKGAQWKSKFLNFNEIDIKMIFSIKAFKQDLFYYPIDQK